MNKFDKEFLNFEVVFMNENNELIFLDTTVFIVKNDKLQLKTYQKLNHQGQPEKKVYTNFQHAVSPRKYKTGVICGEIFRIANTNTTEHGLNNSLSQLQMILWKIYTRRNL